MFGSPTPKNEPNSAPPPQIYCKKYIYLFEISFKHLFPPRKTDSPQPPPQKKKETPKDPHEITHSKTGS